MKFINLKFILLVFIFFGFLLSEINHLSCIVDKNTRDITRNNFYNIVDTQTQQLFPNDKIHLIYGSHISNIDLNVKINKYTVPLASSNLVAIAEQDSILLSWNSSLGPGDSLEYIIFE